MVELCIRMLKCSRLDHHLAQQHVSYGLCVLYKVWYEKKLHSNFFQIYPNIYPKLPDSIQIYTSNVKSEFSFFRIRLSYIPNYSVVSIVTWHEATKGFYFSAPGPARQTCALIKTSLEMDVRQVGMLCFLLPPTPPTSAASLIDFSVPPYSLVRN